MLAAGLLPGVAVAGAWPMPRGATQAIFKYERGRADQGFAVDGSRAPILGVEDDDVSVFVEHGLTSRLTLQAQGGFTRGTDGVQTGEGRGPLSAGLRWTPLVLRSGREVVSVYAGATLLGEGRNSAYLPPGAGDYDGEVRVFYGRSGRLRGRETFLDLQAARLVRSGAPDETRLDVTLGQEVRRDWLVLAQAYAGQADARGRDPLWLKLELGLVRRLGAWRLQAGWRETVAGRLTPAEGGPVLAVWRSF